MVPNTDISASTDTTQPEAQGQTGASSQLSCSFMPDDRARKAFGLAAQSYKGTDPETLIRDVLGEDEFRRYSFEIHDSELMMTVNPDEPHAEFRTTIPVGRLWGIPRGYQLPKRESGPA